MFFDILLPASLPEIFVALRVGMGVAVLVLIASEFVVGNTGLGYMIFHSRQIFFQEAMYVGIFVIAIEGVILAGIVGAIGRRLTPWVNAAKRR